MTDTWYVRLGHRLARAFWVVLGTLWVIFVVVIVISVWWEMSKWPQ